MLLPQQTASTLAARDKRARLNNAKKRGTARACHTRNGNVWSCTRNNTKCWSDAIDSKKKERVALICNGQAGLKTLHGCLSLHRPNDRATLMIACQSEALYTSQIYDQYMFPLRVCSVSCRCEIAKPITTPTRYDSSQELSHPSKQAGSSFFAVSRAIVRTRWVLVAQLAASLKPLPHFCLLTNPALAVNRLCKLEKTNKNKHDLADLPKHTQKQHHALRIDGPCGEGSS